MSKVSPLSISLHKLEVFHIKGHIMKDYSLKGGGDGLKMFMGITFV